VYAEYDETTFNSDWEFAVSFEPEEQSEYEAYLKTTRQEPVCTEGPQQEASQANVQTSWAREYVHKRMLQPTRHKAARRITRGTGKQRQDRLG
jgi:hypothetical protein